MGIHCGVDIIEIERIRKSMESGHGNSFRDKVFTSAEIEYCDGKKAAKYQSYAARFAAKEAVSKALGTGISQGIALKDIQVINDELGKPGIILSAKAKEIFESMNAVDMSISLSHCESYAVAYVVIQVR